MARSGAAAENDTDHYKVLGLPSGEEGSKLTLKEIEKAYRNESRKRHPDKRPDDPNATADFQLLTSSFEVLRDEAARKAFDAVLRARWEHLVSESQKDAKRRKFTSDLEERERAAEFAVDPVVEAERREKKVAADLKRELAAFQARKAAKSSAGSSTSASAREKRGENGPDGAVSLDKEKALKVSWDREGGDYTAAKLRELFESFGTVEDVVIRSKKKKGSAIVVMSSKDAAAAATKAMSGSLFNPLLVLPLHVAQDSSGIFPPRHADTIDPTLSNVVGAGFQDFEASILKKLEKVKGVGPNMNWLSTLTVWVLSGFYERGERKKSKTSCSIERCCFGGHGMA